MQGKWMYSLTLLLLVNGGHAIAAGPPEPPVRTAPIASAAAEPATQLTVEIEGLEEAQGNVHLSIYAGKQNWLGENTVTRLPVAIADALKEGVVTVQLQLPPGEYAFSAFYDADHDGDLDTNFIGIPEEPIAISNNAFNKFGPPKYKRAVFVVGTEPVLQRVKMAEL